MLQLFCGDGTHTVVSHSNSKATMLVALLRYFLPAPDSANTMDPIIVGNDYKHRVVNWMDDVLCHVGTGNFQLTLSDDHGVVDTWAYNKE